MQRSLKPIARAVKRNLPQGAWAVIDDPRDSRGRRHSLTSLLQLLTVGLIAQMPTLRDVEALCTRLACRRTLGVRGRPSDTTLYRVLNGLVVMDVMRVLFDHVNRMRRNGQLQPMACVGGLSLVAIDGKALGCDPIQLHPEAQGYGKGGTAPYVLRVLRAVHTGSAVKPVIGQQTVRAGTPEWRDLVPFARLLRRTYGSAFVECLTLDAGFTRIRDLTELGVWGFHFIVAVKANCAVLHRAARARLGQGDQAPPAGWSWCQTEHSGGRRVTRWFARVNGDEGVSFGAVNQLWRLRQRTERAGSVSWEDRYFASNLPLDRLTDEQAACAIRLHWGIENDSNWTMDAVWKEDRRAWSRQSRSMETLALLRCIAVNLVRLMRSRTLRSTARRAIPYRQLIREIRLALCSPDPLWSGFS